MKERKESRLTRPIHRMPASIRKALLENGVIEAYSLRPAYQRNDYLGWITRAKLEPTRQRRLAQMLDELARGDRYMKMAWRPKRSLPSAEKVCTCGSNREQIVLPQPEASASKRGRRAR